MSFKTFCKEFGDIIPLCAEIKQKDALVFERIDNKLCYKYDVSRVDRRTANFMLRVRDQPSMILEIQLLAETFGCGPKVFEVGQLDFEMMMQTDVNISMSDYVQPFRTVVIQFPEAFCKNRTVDTLPGNNFPEFHEPSFAILYHEPEHGMIVFGLFFSSATSIKTGFALEPDSCVEETIKQVMKTPFTDSLGTTERESQLFVDCFRGCLNYCLLLDEVGIFHKSRNPSIQHSWEQQAKSKNTIVAEKAKHNLRFAPELYGLKQNVKLYREVESSSQLETQPTGRTVSPHHRRGYYRMQRFGPGRQEKKRIRIAPVFVNKKLFLGNLSNTSAVYS